MKQVLQYSAWAIGLPLNLMVIAALVRGTYRQYPFVLAYSLALFLSTVVEIGVNAFPWWQKDNYYWANDIVLELLVFCMVIAFIDEASQRSQKKVLERHSLIVAAALICIVSYAIHHSPHFNRQMTLISRDLNICAVVLDLMLWSLLVAARRPDRQLLLLSGGLGLLLTGEIMGEQLRHVSHALYLVGSSLEAITSLVGLYVWWRALRVAPVPIKLGPIKKGGLPQEPTRY